MSGNITGWEKDKRTHFGEIVDIYDRIRPEYPPELFRDVLSYSGRGSGKAVEIGAGTGRATTPFLDAGYDVTAVEISRNMAEFLLEKYKGCQNFKVITSAFEDATLEDDSCDLIYAASAFHWVDAQIGCPKMLRLLKNGGVCALFRYSFNIVPAEGEELHEAFLAVYERYYDRFYQTKTRPVRITHELLASPSKTLSGYGFEDLSKYGFGDVTMKLYDATMTYHADDYTALLDTMSDHRSLPEDIRAALYAGIRSAIQSHGRYHKMEITFQLYMGRKPSL